MHTFIFKFFTLNSLRLIFWKLRQSRYFFQEKNIQCKLFSVKYDMYLWKILPIYSNMKENFRSAMFISNTMIIAKSKFFNNFFFILPTYGRCYMYREFIFNEWKYSYSMFHTFVYTCWESITCPIFWTPIIMSLCIIWNTNTWPSNFGFSRFISKIHGWFHTGSWVFWRTFVLCFASLIPFTYISTLTYGSIWKQRKCKIKND